MRRTATALGLAICATASLAGAIGQVEQSLAVADHLVARAFIAPRDSTLLYCRQAEKILLESTSENPGDARLLARLALVNGRLAEFEKNSAKVERVRTMDRLCRSAIASDSTNAMAHMVLGVLNYRLCRLSWIERTLAKAFIGDLPQASLEDAERYLRRAIRLRGSNPACFYALGRTLEALGRETEAIDTLRLALTVEPMGPLDTCYQEKAAARLEGLIARQDGPGYPWEAIADES